MSTRTEFPVKCSGEENVPKIHISVHQLEEEPNDLSEGHNQNGTQAQVGGGSSMSSTNALKSRRGKRPDVAIYKPNQSRRSLETNNQSSQREQDSSETNSSITPLPLEDKSTKVRKKRPDQPKYVPKRRIRPSDSVGEVGESDASVAQLPKNNPTANTAVDCSTQSADRIEDGVMAASADLQNFRVEQFNTDNTEQSNLAKKENEIKNSSALSKLEDDKGDVSRGRHPRQQQTVAEVSTRRSGKGHRKGQQALSVSGDIALGGASMSESKSIPVDRFKSDGNDQHRLKITPQNKTTPELSTPKKTSPQLSSSKKTTPEPASQEIAEPESVRSGRQSGSQCSSNTHGQAKSGRKSVTFENSTSGHSKGSAIVDMTALAESISELCPSDSRSMGNSEFSTGSGDSDLTKDPLPGYANMSTTTAKQKNRRGKTDSGTDKSSQKPKINSSRGNPDNKRLYDPYSSEQAPQQVGSAVQSSRPGLLRVSSHNDQLHPTSGPQLAVSSGDAAEVFYNSTVPSPPLADSQLRYLGDGDYSYVSHRVPSGSEIMHPPVAMHPPDLVHSAPLQPAYAAHPPYTYSRVQQQYYPAPAPDLTVYEQQCDIGNTRSTSRHHKVGVFLRDVMPLEKQLSTLISTKQFSMQTLDHINRLRTTVREKMETLLLLDLEYSANQNVDQLLWKSVHHQLLEALRSQLQHGGTTDAEDIRLHISKILEEADVSYRSLISKLERQCQFELAEYTSPHRPTQPMSRHLKLALILAQRLLICLGDIARYSTQNGGGAGGASDYGKSRKLYLQASNVAAKNGKPYNQLAIIALYAKRKLDTVFYFMRSIAASNAFLSAKESLRAIYSDIIKKYKQTRQESEGRKQKLSRSTRGSTRGRQGCTDDYHRRIELWISPIDGSSVTDHVDELADVDNPSKMPCNELYRRLMTTFLACQGILFSKVGMEHFPEASSQALHQLDALISHSPIPLIDTTKLIHMFAIAMFSVHQTGLQVEATALGTTEKCRSYTQEQAVLLYLDMSTIVIKRCSVLISAAAHSGTTPNQAPQSKSSTNHLMTHGISLLLPVVKLVTDWMTCHPQLWNPPPCPRDPMLGPVLDPWLSMAQLANALTQLDGLSSIRFYSGADVDSLTSSLTSPHHSPYTWLSFQEEIELKGFLPLMNSANDVIYIDSTDSSSNQADLAAMCYRCTKIITFADYLCGIEPAMLEFGTQTSKYRSIVEPPSASEKTPHHQLNCSDPQYAEMNSDSASDLSDVSSEDEGVEGVGITTSELTELRRTKRLLSQQLAQQQRQQKIHQAVLETESSHGVIRLEIRPIYVVPDTNCFIEYLQLMVTLITSQKFTVVIPLVVINELDGLSRGGSGFHSSNTPTSSTHEENVKQVAAEAVQFLESEFESRNKRLKALTVSGTELHAIAYRNEQISPDDGNNDDRILSCCLHYCKDNARDFMPKDKENVIKLYREVVLVTDDRNLRLKAHTRNVPVKDLIQFIEWAGIRGN